MKLIIGLGNPGEKYKKTRHNIGFVTIDCLAEIVDIESLSFDNKFNSLIADFTLKDKKLILAKPQTFMNNSGLAVSKIADYFNIKPENIIIIHDDLDLELGQIKIQKNKGSAGHKGIESIINHLKTKEFYRIRIGIKPKDKKPENPENFVIQKFNQEEQIIIKENIKKAAQIILNREMDGNEN